MAALLAVLAVTVVITPIRAMAEEPQPEFATEFQRLQAMLQDSETRLAGISQQVEQRAVESAAAATEVEAAPAENYSAVEGKGIDRHPAVIKGKRPLKVFRSISSEDIAPPQAIEASPESTVVAQAAPAEPETFGVTESAPDSKLGE